MAKNLVVGSKIMPNQKTANKALEEILIVFLYRLCLNNDLIMEYPPEPPHDHDIELSQDSEYEYSPNK